MNELNLDESMGFLVYGVHIRGTAQLRRAFQVEGFDDITPEQLSLMARLREREGMNQSQLAERTLKDRPNITRILRLLLRKGLIERRAGGGSKRAYQLFLTEAGNAVLDRLIPVVQEIWRSRLAGFNPQEIRKLRTMLKQISRNIGASMYRL